MYSIFHTLIFSAVLFLGGCSASQTGTQTSEPVSLSATEFAEKMKALPEATIIDVRTPDEFSNGHLAGAVNITWNGDTFDEEISKLDKTKPVFVYCLSGGRSSAAADEMSSVGFSTVYELKGGLMQWRSAGLPEVSGNETGQEEMTRAQFNQMTNTDKQVLVDFYAEWCAPCKKMEPYLNEISTTMSDKVTVLRIDADKNKTLCSELKIENLPVLQLYRKGEMVWTHTGFIEKEEVLKQLD